LLWSSRDITLIGTCSKLADYNYTSSLALWARAGGCKQSLPRYPKGQSRTRYQECGCHLEERKTFCLFCEFVVWYFCILCGLVLLHSFSRSRESCWSWKHLKMDGT